MIRAAQSRLEDILGRLSLDYQALLLCSRVRLDADQGARLESLLADQRLSWPSLVYLAGWHRLSGLLYYHLRKAASTGQVPPWVQTRLRTAYLHNAARNLYFRGQLRTALTILGSSGIPVIALKGVVLLEKVFRDPGLRTMKDIDLLVPADRAEEAQALLCQMGYQPMGSPEAQERTRREHRHLPVLADPQRLVALEIHSHIVAKRGPFRFDLTDFWERAQETSIAGVPVLVLCPEHMLAHLSVHFFLDRRFRSYGALAQICDIAEAVRTYQSTLDWALLEQQTARLGLAVPVYCGLLLARTLLDAPVPTQVLEQLQPHNLGPGALELLVKRRVLDTRQPLASALVGPDQEYNLLNWAKGVVSRVVPRRSYLAERYGPSELARRPVRSYLRRWREVATLLGRYMFSPMELWEEMMVDRWIHRLSSGGNGKGGRQPSSLHPQAPKTLPAGPGEGAGP